MAIPVIAQVLIGLFTAAVIVAEPKSQTLRLIAAKRAAVKGVKTAKLVGPLAKPNPRFPNAPMFPTGPLPKQALLAAASKEYGPNNDIHKKDHWFQFGRYSDDWFAKRALLRFYASPPSTKFVVQKIHHRNVCWMARCPDSWYPGAGKAQLKNCRVSAISQWIGPKADWKSWTEAFKSSVKGIPQVLKAAGVVVAAIFSFGGTALVKTGKQVDTVSAGVKAALKPIGDVGRSWKKRLEASEAMIRGINNAYLAQMKDANPYCVRADGVFDTSKRYLANPKTWDDLRVARLGEPTDYPLLYNPPKSPT